MQPSFFAIVKCVALKSHDDLYPSKRVHSTLINEDQCFDWLASSVAFDKENGKLIRVKFVAQRFFVEDNFRCWFPQSGEEPEIELPISEPVNDSLEGLDWFVGETFNNWRKEAGSRLAELLRDDIVKNFLDQPTVALDKISKSVSDRLALWNETAFIHGPY